MHQQLFVVDDAHQLDHLSATLIYQLAVGGSARLIVTIRSGAELPDAVAALWADELLNRVEVGPLDAAATTALLESALPTPPDAGVVDQAFAHSQGNPLHLRHLVDSGDLTNGATLPALIDAYLSGLPSPARRILDYLALAEPLQRGDVTALAGEGAVDQAEADGAVAIHGDLVYSAHPLYTAARGCGAGAGRRAGVAHVAGRTPHGRAVHPCRRPAAARGAGRRKRQPRCGRRLRVRGPACAAVRRARAGRAARPGGAGPHRRTARAAGTGLRAGLAGPRTASRLGAGRGGPGPVVAVRADGVGAAAGGQPVLDAQRTGAGHRVSAVHPEPGFVADGAGHPRRAGGDIRDERGNTVAHVADRRRGAGIAARRREWRSGGLPRRRR